MPCQCGTTATLETDATITAHACECATESAAGCECGGGSPAPLHVEGSLERVVMELDKRLRKLEASR